VKEGAAGKARARGYPPPCSEHPHSSLLPSAVILDVSAEDTGLKPRVLTVHIENSRELGWKLVGYGLYVWWAC
jgi:hypothetical protein